MSGFLISSLIAASTTMLFVGNSYTFANGGLETQVQSIYESVSPDTLFVIGHSSGGATYENHWNNTALLELIETKDIDIGVFQEQSCMPVIDPEMTYLYGDSLAFFCLSHVVQPAFLMTWARKNDPLMLRGLHDGYSRMGSVHSSPVTPCGVAFDLIRQTHPEIDPYEGDGAHPSVSGSYLAACVIAATLLETDLSQTGIWNPPEVPAPVGEILRETAVAACSLFQQPMEAVNEL